MSSMISFKGVELYDGVSEPFNRLFVFEVECVRIVVGGGGVGVGFGFRVGVGIGIGVGFVLLLELDVDAGVNAVGSAKGEKELKRLPLLASSLLGGVASLIIFALGGSATVVYEFAQESKSISPPRSSISPSPKSILLHGSKKG